MADRYPDKVKELEALFWKEAERNQVLPMDSTTFTRSLIPRPNLTAGRTVFNYSGKIAGTANANAPNVLASSFNFKAEVEVPEGGGEGMLVTHGGLGAETLLYGSPSGLGQSGTGDLKVDGKVVATKKFDKTIPMLMQWCESFDVGSDTGSPVSDLDYKTPFAFTGELNKLTLTIDRPELSKEDIKKLQAAINKAAD